MEQIIGRETEIQVLKDALASQQAELIAVYGRRRVGKTYLIRSVYERKILFEFTGLKDADLPQQIENFTLTLATAFKIEQPLTRPENWLQAFRLLINHWEAKRPRTKKVIFLDELPWLDTPKSGFLAAFDHFWNNWASRQKNLVVVICGSAASWMIQNIVRNKGGLHNRITQRLRLQPFNLYETALYLKSKRVNLDPYSILQLYMVTGGIPQYLKDIKTGESALQAIDRLCFSDDGGLRDEFKYLYAALFDNPDRHICVVKALAEKPSGMTRTEIMSSCEFSSGGSFSKLIHELLESGFIAQYIPFGKTTNELIYKLCDEYSLFYLKFIENSKSTGKGSWLKKSTGQSWTSWSGFAFENICLRHIPQIKKALGISGIYTEQSVWRYAANKEETGAQIDLLIDRQDNCINLCEIKFYNTEFIIDKKYADELENKRTVFLQKCQPKKSVFITLLTTFGAKENEQYWRVAQNQLKMSVLFERVH